MYSKGSNLVSVAVAFISIGLIVLAVFLLNQTFSNKPGMASSSGSTSSLTVVSARGSLSTYSNAKSLTTMSSSSRSSSSLADNESSQASSLSSSSNLSSTNSSNSSSTSSTVSLASGQLLVKYLGTQDGVNYEIVSCQISNPKKCKTGFKFQYSDTKDKVAGEVYKFDGCEINDKDDALELSNCKILK